MPDGVSLPGGYPPDVSGVHFRGFRGSADLPAIIAVHAARQEHDQVDPCSRDQHTPTVEELVEIYTQRDDFDPALQMLMAEANGLLVGYTWIRSWIQDEQTWMCAHRTLLRPEWRGQGVGTAMLHWAEQRLAAIAAYRPDGVNAFYRSAVADSERETVARLQNAGYEVAHRTHEMLLDDLNVVDAHADVLDLTIRAPEPDEYRQVYFANEAAFVDEWDHVERTDDDFEAFMKRPGCDPALWRVAWVGGEVAGVVMAEKSVCGGVISDLSVGQAWRGRGIGRALLASGLRALQSQGARQARLYVEGDDPFGARRLYERAGFRVIKTYLHYLKPIVS